MRFTYGHIPFRILSRSVGLELVLLLLIVSLSSNCLGQDLKAKESLRAGNTHYESGDYEKALKSYDKANRYDSTYAKATYNLANTLYQQGNLEEAVGRYEEAAELFTENEDLSRIHHNIGRSHLQSALGKIQGMQATGGQPSDQSQDPRPDLQASLSEFKEALMLDPNDEEARYNYGYSKKLLEQLPPSQEEQQDQQGDEGEDQEEQDQQEEQNQDKKNDEDRDGKDQNQDDDQESEQEEKEREKNKQAQDPNRMNAEQQLDLLDQEEKDLQKQMNKQRMAGSKVRVEKDW